MSRSNNTTTDQVKNPATRWFEWDSDKSTIKYYDKEEKKHIHLKLPFTFLVLDQTATITGYNEQSESGIYSNEVKSTKNDKFVVKAFKGGVLANGLYSDIKDSVKSQGGKFTSNVYIAYKEGKSYAIGCLQFKGASLQSWSDFSKNHRGSIMTKAIEIASFDKGKKGKVEYTTPAFTLRDASAEANDKAVEMDKALQEYFVSYMGKQEEPKHDIPTQLAKESKSSIFEANDVEESDNLPF